MKILVLIGLLGGLTMAGLVLSGQPDLPEKSAGNPPEIPSKRLSASNTPAPSEEVVTRNPLDAPPEETLEPMSGKIHRSPKPIENAAPKLDAGGPPEVELLYRFESGGLSLPLHWIALDHFVWDGAPVPLGQGKMGYRNGRMVSHDTIGLSLSELRKVLEPFPRLKDSVKLVLPSDDRYLFHVEAGSGIADFVMASVFFDNPAREYGAATNVQGDPSVPGTGIPRDTVPPDRKLWIFGPRDRNELDNHAYRKKRGLGFGGIRREGGGFFAPRRTEDDEIDSSSAWLCAARDPATGDWWLWFEE